MDITGLAMQLVLLVVCLVAVGVSVVVLLALGMAAAGDGSPPATAKDRWEARLIVVGAISVAIVIVGLIIASLGVLWNIGGLEMTVKTVVLCILGIRRWA